MSSGDEQNPSRYVIRGSNNQKSVSLVRPQPVTEDKLLPRLTPLMRDMFIQLVKDNLEFVRTIINEASNEVIGLRNIDKETAKTEIHEFLKQNQGSLSSDIVDKLRISPELVSEILIELEKEDKVQSQSIE